MENKIQSSEEFQDKKQAKILPAFRPKKNKSNNNSIKAKIRSQNPKYSFFNLDSSFVYESRLSYFHYSMSNKNII